MDILKSIVSFVDRRRANVQFTIGKEYPFTAEGVSQSQIDISSRGTVGKLLIKVSE
jgi:NADPH2:quinone reductase